MLIDKNKPIPCPLIISCGQKKSVLILGNVLILGKFPYFIEILPSQNKHIFVTAKRVCLFLEMCLFWVCLS